MKERNHLTYSITYPDGQGHHFDIAKVLFYGGTPMHKEVGLFVTTSDSMVLVIDGREQTNSRNQAAYHRALTEPMVAQAASALALSTPKKLRALVLGAGPGATGLALVKMGFTTVVQVDIDEEVVNLAVRHMKKWHEGTLCNGQYTTTIIADAATWVEAAVKNHVKYDAIVYDLTEPDSDPNAVFLPSFFDKLAKILSADGVFTAQLGYAAAEGIEQVEDGYRMLSGTDLRGGVVVRDPVSCWAFYHLTRGAAK